MLLGQGREEGSEKRTERGNQEAEEGREKAEKEAEMSCHSLFGRGGRDSAIAVITCVFRRNFVNLTRQSREFGADDGKTARFANQQGKQTEGYILLFCANYCVSWESSSQTLSLPRKMKWDSDFMIASISLKSKAAQSGYKPPIL